MKLEKEKFKEHGFLVILVALSGLIILDPILSLTKWGNTTLAITFSLVLFSCVYLVAAIPRHGWIAFVLACLAFISSILIDFQIYNDDYGVINSAFNILFLSYICFLLLRFVLLTDKISKQTIHAALTFYLLFGINWAMIYLLMYNIDPASFAGIDNIQSDNPLRNFFYFSFVTLTTLGYGDITPVSNWARSWSTVEAFSGQLYIAVVLARLIGLWSKERT